MGIIAAEFLAQEAFDLDDLGGEAVRGEKFLDLVHTEEVPMVFVSRSHDVLGDFVHLEEVGADRAPSDATEFFDGNLQAFDGEMFEQVVNEAEIESIIRRAQFEKVADVKMRVGKKGAGILDVYGAEVEASVIEKACDPVRMEETIVVGGAAGRFENGEERSKWWGFGGKSFAPQVLEGATGMAG